MQAAVILIILLVISFDNLIAQNEIYNLPSSDIKVNATCTYYKSKSDFITNTNASQGLLEITRQNDFIFSVKPINTKSKTKDPNREIYIIITERDTLINLIFYSTIPEFSKVILLDSFFILFQPKDDYSPFMEPGISLAGFLYKELYKSSLNKYMPIIINQNTEKKMYLTKAQLKFNLKRLKDERIINEFKAEKDYTLEVMLKYFKHFMQHKASIKDE